MFRPFVLDLKRRVDEDKRPALGGRKAGPHRPVSVRLVNATPALALESALQGGAIRGVLFPEIEAVLRAGRGARPAGANPDRSGGRAVRFPRLAVEGADDPR